MTRLLYAMTSTTATPADYYSRAAHALTTHSEADTSAAPLHAPLPTRALKPLRVGPIALQHLDEWHAALPPTQQGQGWTTEELQALVPTCAQLIPTNLRYFLEHHGWVGNKENRGTVRARCYWYPPAAATPATPHTTRPTSTTTSPLSYHKPAPPKRSAMQRLREDFGLSDEEIAHQTRLFIAPIELV
jgi:hypothetical protein